MYSALKKIVVSTLAKTLLGLLPQIKRDKGVRPATSVAYHTISFLLKTKIWVGWTTVNGEKLKARGWPE